MNWPNSRCTGAHQTYPPGKKNNTLRGPLGILDATTFDVMIIWTQALQEAQKAP